MLVRGVGRRLVGRKFNVSPDSVGRHWVRHVPESSKVARKVEWAAPEADVRRLTLAETEGVALYLRRLRADLIESFAQAKSDGHYASISAISRELRGVLELSAKLSGELSAASKGTGVVNVALDPDYLELRHRLLNTLRRFPEAFEAVLAEFARTEEKAAAIMAAETPLIEANPIGVTPAQEVGDEPRE
jgi:hypothetical protein